MNLFIKVWPNQSATLMTENGYALSTFDCADEAKKVCREWYESNGMCTRQLEESLLREPHLSPMEAI